MKSFNHRTYPGKLVPKEPGRCHWCGSLILKRDGTIHLRKHWCNQKCVQAYLLRADPKVMRRHVYYRDDGACRGCGLVFDFYEDDGWQADHIIPLYVAHSDWSCWEPDNVQLLCTPCHQVKTQNDYARWGRPGAKRAW